MKKYFILVLIFNVSIVGKAQNTDSQKFLLTTTSRTFGISMPNVIDPYLSPLVYGGFGMNLNQENRRYFKPDNIRYSMQDKLTLSAGMMLNPAFSSEMLYIGANYGWGVNYHFRLTKGLKILAGGLWDVDFGFKNVPRNINNPINLDMATNLNLTGLLIYDYPTRRRTLHLQAALQAPIIGYMFVPQGGASYYDMFQLGSLSNAFHFSSLHNKRGLNQTYTVDVPFNHSTWRFGLHFQNLKYKANNLVFAHNETSVIVGTTFDAISFSGKKKVAPQNFMSTND